MNGGEKTEGKKIITVGLGYWLVGQADVIGHACKVFL